MPDATSKPEGLRERKRRETLQRIAEVGLKLFLAKGYEATTLDEIAAAAHISRRTFFYYFKSKDDILLAHQGRYANALTAQVVENATPGSPFDVARDALIALSSRFQEPQLIATARLLREGKALGARRSTGHQQLEQALYAGLSELWPGKRHSDRLQLVAMASIAALRLAVDTWLQQDGKRPLPKYIRDAFKNLKAEICR